MIKSVALISEGTKMTCGDTSSFVDAVFSIGPIVCVGLAVVFFNNARNMEDHALWCYHKSEANNRAWIDAYDLFKDGRGHEAVALLERHRLGMTDY
jgi:hypothetical protein